jgi:hypothetical protein
MRVPAEHHRISDLDDKLLAPYGTIRYDVHVTTKVPT